MLIFTITDPTIYEYVDTIDYRTSYEYKILAYNWVGSSPGHTSILINVLQTADATQSTIEYPTSPKAQISFEVKVNLKDSASNIVISDSKMILEVSDLCEVSYGYECVRIDTSHIDYNNDLLDGYEYKLFTNNNDGTMTAIYTAKLAGRYKLNVIQLNQYEILGNYWDNFWYYSDVDLSRIDSNLDMNWDENTLITTHASNFISVK